MSLFRSRFVTACQQLLALGAVLADPVFIDYPFQLGVASGDPLPDGFVIWTRLAPRPLEIEVEVLL